MTMKKIIAGSLAAIMFLSCMSFILTDNLVYAKTDITKNADKFHYAQLDETAQSIYDGIYTMYEKGILKTGTQDYDLAANGHFSDKQLQECVKNNPKLTNAMNAARYAFYADYPEVFYVNFPKLSLRTTKGEDGTFHIYLGSGRYENYYIDGFSNEAEVNAAVQSFDARVNEIVKGADALKVPEGKNKQVEQIRYVHNEIINNVSYRLEDTCFEGDDDNKSNASYLGTPYGALVKKQAVCEGYARAFKTVMDKMNINCILVQGVHQYDSEVAVSHMWNYVEITDTETNARQIGGKWYAMDLTQDDPECFIVTDKEWIDYTQHFDTYGKDGFENEKYFLAGQLTLNGRHFIDETIDAAGGYEFTYPAIEDVDYGTRDVINTMDGFSVKQKTITGSHGLDITEFQISYKGMNMSTARKEGIYLLAKYYDEDKDGNIVPLTGWCYFAEGYEFKEDDTSVYIQEGEVMYMEFAATNVKPRPGLEGYTYAGDDFGLIARTGKIYNENQNDYKAPPFILRATPSQTATIFPGNALYHITLEYHEALELADGVSEDDLSIMITCKSSLGADVSGAEYSKISNVVWDGNKTVEFDVKFSQMFADDNVIYNFYPTGLVGVNSKKSPNPASYGVATKTECPSVQNRRGSWDIFGKPTLMEEKDLSVQDWTLSNGKQVSDKLTNRIALVATKTTDDQESQMKDILNQDIPGAGDKIVESSTYNITLSVCKLAVVETGHKVKVKVGFPAGYGPEDEGVTFKAYHFKRDAQGNVIGVEEIDCVVTPYGLIITCESFSPFTIAAVEKDETTTSQQKSVIATTSDGGTVTGADLNDAKILKLSDGDSKTLSIKPNEGYEIESVTVCGKDIAVTDKNAMNITVSYDDADANNIVHANFVAKSVAEKEANRNETPVKPIAEPATVTLPGSLNVSDELTITPFISETPGVQTYQWYKDGEKLDGKTNRELNIQNVTDSDAGSYQLQVTTTVDTASVDVMSAPCVVTVSEACQHTNKVKLPAVSSTCTVQGHGEYVFCNDCNAVISGSDAKLPLAPHNNIEKAEAQYLKAEATCTAKAVYFKSCSVCGEKSAETFEHGTVKEHNGTVVRNDKPATCTEEGYTGDFYCKDCNVKTADGTVVPAKGHILVKVEAKEATHDTNGNSEHYACSDCNKLFKDADALVEITLEDIVISKGEHIYSEDYKFDAENHWKVCDCGNVAETEAHKFNDWTVTKNATETENGSKERTCSVCGYKEVAEILADGAADYAGSDGEKVPETGYNSHIILWAVLSVLSGSALCINILSHRKKKVR